MNASDRTPFSQWGNAQTRRGARNLHLVSTSMTAVTGVATLFVIVILVTVLGDIFYHGWGALSWNFLFSGIGMDSFASGHLGLLPMMIGTVFKVFLMTLVVMPMGVITALYLTEYANPHSTLTRMIHSAVNNLAGVPSIIFGLFGWGFFIKFMGVGLDEAFSPNNPEPVWGKPAILWASMTLAIMTLPVVIVTTEEALKSLPSGLRYASYALGASRLQTLFLVLLPQALPGILTGAILAIGRAAGEVAPLLFTGAAYYTAAYPWKLNDEFMDLGYHIYILATQSPDVENTTPVAYATVLVLLVLTLGLNLVTILIRARIRHRFQQYQMVD